MIVYGIKNCDSVKKCRALLQQQQREHTFHDYRSDGIDQDLLKRFLAELGAEAIVNRRGTTWRQLPDERKCEADDDRLIDLLLAMPALIKRPIIDDGKRLWLGLDSGFWDEQ